jgi:hypothetical protein
MSAWGPAFYHQEQTSSGHPGISEKCQKRKCNDLLDHLVAAAEADPDDWLNLNLPAIVLDPLNARRHVYQ